MPKPVANRNPIPPFERQEVEVENRMRKTDPDVHYERAKKMHGDFMSGGSSG